MTQDHSTAPSRRTLARAAAWSVPVVSLAAAAPAVAASSAPGGVYGDCPTLCVSNQRVYPRIRVVNDSDCSVLASVGFSGVMLAGQFYQVRTASTGDSQAIVAAHSTHVFTQIFTQTFAGATLPQIGDAVNVAVRLQVYSSQCGDNGAHPNDTQGFVFACVS